MVLLNRTVVYITDQTSRLYLEFYCAQKPMVPNDFETALLPVSGSWSSLCLHRKQMQTYDLK